jgi:hypothetical protein
MFSSTTFSSSNLRVQRTRPGGGSEQAKAIKRASFSPSKILGTAGVARCLRLKTASKPSSTSCLRTRYTREVLVSSACMIWLSLHPSPDPETSAFSNIRAFNRRCAGLFPFRMRSLSRCRSSSLSLTTYFFTEISFSAMIASVAGVATKTNHSILSKRATQGTSTTT